MVNTLDATQPAKRDDKAGTTPEKKKVSWKDRLKPVAFALFGFLCWFIFMTLARVVIKCAPVGPCTASEIRPPSPLGWPDTVVLLTTLGLAIWAARRFVYPPED